MQTIGCRGRALSEPDWPLLRTEAPRSGAAGTPPSGAMWGASRCRVAGPALLGLLLALSVRNSGASKASAGLVTCGSVLKLLNTHHRVRLHSHDIKYGSGAQGW